MIGGLRISGPGDFNFEVSGMKQLVDIMHGFPCNFILSAHILDKYGKPRPRPGMSQSEIDALVYAPNEIVGEKLNLRDQVGETLLSCFSNVFRFSRESVGGKLKFYVEFASEICGNAFGIPPGVHDITGKNFYNYLQDLIKKIKEGTWEPPKNPNSGIFS
jgi:hypothetical protein